MCPDFVKKLKGKSSLRKKTKAEEQSNDLDGQKLITKEPIWVDRGFNVDN